MDWTEIVVAAIAGAGGFLGAIVSNNKQLATLATESVADVTETEGGELR